MLYLPEKKNGYVYTVDDREMKYLRSWKLFVRDVYIYASIVLESNRIETKGTRYDFYRIWLLKVSEVNMLSINVSARVRIYSTYHRS